jgi:cbb3-type cytochrome c oxidase subunit III
MISKAIVVMAVALGGMATLGEGGAGDPVGRTYAAEQDTAGKGIFTGKGLCHVCHGADGKGTALAPNLTDDKWLHSDGSLENIVKTITTGVTQPKEHPAPMAPMGGAQLTEAEVQAVARYVYALSHPK